MCILRGKEREGIKGVRVPEGGLPYIYICICIEYVCMYIYTYVCMYL